MRWKCSVTGKERNAEYYDCNYCTMAAGYKKEKDLSYWNRFDEVVNESFWNWDIALAILIMIGIPIFFFIILQAAGSMMNSGC